ncbi:MAG: sel1 repeat family protein [Burkholderiales bacterium]|nr:sel1 repeat family protein [Burkholderiales bacterium]
MNLFKSVTLAACLMLGTSSHVYAQKKHDLEPAISALKQGNAAAAVNYLDPLAKRGNADAQFMLVSALQTIDQQKAVYWLRKAAENKQPDAAHILGLMYLQGNGVPEDLPQAKKFLTVAAEKGNPGAQLQLAIFYRTGPVAMQNDNEAFKWMKKAADSGVADAQFRLADMYRYGYGVAPDAAEVQKWLKRAAQQGHVQAMQELGGAR